MLILHIKLLLIFFVCVLPYEKRQAGKPSSVYGRHISVFAVADAIMSDLPAGIGRGIHLLLNLAPDEVYLATSVTRWPGELLLHLFTLTRKEISSKRYIFCGTGCRQKVGARELPGILPCGARTFL
ncbi:hypothetical protein JY97_05845 [Alkalispirochaeta odontotermitis]|nr:hypothetical protein JY97_05845 [Alkalispirochaeta odontotermitis]